MFRINIALTILLASLSASSASVGYVDLDVSKVVVLSGESDTFRDKIHVPCCEGCSRTCIPSDITTAIEVLSRGLEAKILNNSVRSMTLVCQELGNSCNPRNEDLWSQFSASTKLVEIEPEHSLDEYLSGVNYSIAKAWGLERTCMENDNLCQWFRIRVRASPYMLSEMIVRGVLLRASGIEFNFDDLVASMGDLVRVESQNGGRR